MDWTTFLKASITYPYITSISYALISYALIFKVNSSYQSHLELERLNYKGKVKRRMRYHISMYLFHG